ASDRGVSNVAFHPGMKQLVSADFFGRAKTWGLSTEQECLTLAGSKGGVRALGFHPGGNYFGSGGLVKRIKRWNLAKLGEAPRVWEQQEQVEGLAYGSGGRSLVIASLNAIIVRDADTGAEIQRLNESTEFIRDLSYCDRRQVLVTTTLRFKA